MRIYRFNIISGKNYPTPVRAIFGFENKHKIKIYFQSHQLSKTGLLLFLYKNLSRSLYHIAKADFYLLLLFFQGIVKTGVPYSVNYFDSSLQIKLKNSFFNISFSLT